MTDDLELPRLACGFGIKGKKRDDRNGSPPISIGTSTEQIVVCRLAPFCVTPGVEQWIDTSSMMRTVFVEIFSFGENRPVLCFRFVFTTIFAKCRHPTARAISNYEKTPT